MRMRIKRRMMMRGRRWMRIRMRMRMKKWGRMGRTMPRGQGEGGETLSMSLRMRMVKKCSGKTM